ncbi:MAG: hypothetical protein HYY06_26470 [Deltaproteobacteria bacterium]|nr:hypothetical protein [Deltaproteobacteria bacterium]
MGLAAGRVRAGLFVLLGAGPMFPTECDCLDYTSPEEALSRYVRGIGDTGLPIVDPVTKRQWVGEALPERSFDRQAHRACQAFWSRRVGEADGATDVVEVCFRLERSDSGWWVSEPRFSRLLSR